MPTLSPQHLLGRFRLSVTADPRDTFAGEPTPDIDLYTVTTSTTLNGITGIRLEMLQDASLPFNGPGRQPTNGNFVLTHLTLDAAPIPEPGPYALLLAGILTLRIVFRRRARLIARQFADACRVVAGAAVRPPPRPRPCRHQGRPVRNAGR